MSRSLQQVNQAIIEPFFVYDSSGNPVTGLVNGAFTKRNELNGVSSAVVITVTEDANGRYYASMTPNANGTWFILITHATYNPNGWESTYDVKADGFLTLASIWGYILDTGFSALRLMKIIAAAVAGRTTGGPAGFTARNLADTQDQIAGSADANGNRTPGSYGS